MNYGASVLMAAKFWTRNPEGDMGVALLAWVRAVCPLQRGSLLRLLAVWWHQSRTLPIAFRFCHPSGFHTKGVECGLGLSAEMGSHNCLTIFQALGQFC